MIEDNPLKMNISTRSCESLLPFLVVEAMTSQNISFDAMSVRMMDRGWAWLVSGRKLLVWKFKESKTQSVTRARRTLSPCFELQLPQSDLVHKAELVNVFFMPQNLNTSLRPITIPSAISVSPEGMIRYWSSVANERFIESSINEVQGQEFCSLASISPMEYIVGTTTGSVHLLTIDTVSSDQRGMIVCTSLAAPSGILSGIGKRMTSMFFGPAATQSEVESRKPLFAIAKSNTDNQLVDTTFFVLSPPFKLCQWTRANEGSNKQNQLVREWNLHESIQKKLTSLLGIPDSYQLNFWPVDMISTRSKELLILIVTLDTSRENTINYATIVFNPYQAGHRISKTTIMRSHSWHYTNESEDQLLALRFVERCARSPLCFMYDRKFLFLAQVDEDILDAVDYANQDDGVLGAGLFDSQPLLFTQRDGLISINSIKCQVKDTNEDCANISRLNANSTLNSLNSTRPFVTPDTILENSQINSTIDAHEANEQQQAADITENRENSTTNRVTNQSKKDANVNELDFTLHKEFEWIHHIEQKRYGLAGEILAKIASEEELEYLQDRKETLCALSKLAKLAD